MSAATPESKNIAKSTILERVALGETDAVQECLSAYGGLVRALARRTLFRPGDIDDAIQEVFIDVWRNAGRFDPGRSSEKNFVAMLARRRLIDRLRRGKSQPETRSIEEAFEIADPYASDPEQIAEARLAIRGLGRLKEDQRRMIRLSIHLGMSHGEIAQVTHVPLGTVKSHLRRGLAALRQQATAAEVTAARAVGGTC